MPTSNRHEVLFHVWQLGQHRPPGLSVICCASSAPKIGIGSNKIPLVWQSSMLGYWRYPWKPRTSSAAFWLVQIEPKRSLRTMKSGVERMSAKLHGNPHPLPFHRIIQARVLSVIFPTATDTALVRSSKERGSSEWTESKSAARSVHNSDNQTDLLLLPD